jgi:hypothetical protein
LIGDEELQVVVINWVANPFRGDKFEEAWAPAAEAVVRYGAHAWAFARSKDDPVHFMQMAVFDKKLDFDRYWYSEEMAEARVKCSGMYQVPILPVWWRSIGVGVVRDTLEPGEIEAA